MHGKSPGRVTAPRVVGGDRETIPHYRSGRRGHAPPQQLHSRDQRCTGAVASDLVSD